MELTRSNLRTSARNGLIVAFPLLQRYWQSELGDGAVKG